MERIGRPPKWALQTALAVSLCACAGSREMQAQRELDALAPASPATAGGRRVAPKAGPPRSLEDLLVHAMAESPELEAAYQEARASTLHIARSRRLPEPKLTYGYFIRNVETRVGPQRHRFGLSQTIPWPTRLSAGAEAQSAHARAAHRKLEATRLALRRRVVRSYYRLWRLHHEARIERDQLALLRELSEASRAQLAAGRTTLAALTQLDLALARRSDRLVGLKEGMAAARARLRADCGLPTDAKPELEFPDVTAALPSTDEGSLRAQAGEHPLIASMDTLADAGDERGRSAEAEGLPSFTLGIDYIETGEASQPGVPDSGKDPIVAMVSVSLPLWFDSYDREAEAHRAEASALRARADGLRDRASANVDAALVALRDSARRVAFHRGTLEPQALTAYESVISSYAGGRATIASVLLAQRDLLEIRLEQVAAEAAHSVAWADLEHAVGATVPRREAP